MIFFIFKNKIWHIFNAPKTGVGMKKIFGDVIFLVKDNNNLHFWTFLCFEITIKFKDSGAKFALKKIITPNKISLK